MSADPPPGYRVHRWALIVLFVLTLLVVLALSVRQLLAVLLAQA